MNESRVIDILRFYQVRNLIIARMVSDTRAGDAIEFYRSGIGDSWGVGNLKASAYQRN